MELVILLLIVVLLPKNNKGGAVGFKVPKSELGKAFLKDKRIAKPKKPIAWLNSHGQ